MKGVEKLVSTSQNVVDFFYSFFIIPKVVTLVLDNTNSLK